MWQSILSSVKTFLPKFFKSALQAELAVLMPIALNVVKQIEADPTLVTNDAKRSAGIKQIGDQASQAQVQAGLSLINLALELACQEVKAGDKQ